MCRTRIQSGGSAELACTGNYPLPRGFESQEFAGPGRNVHAFEKPDSPQPPIANIQSTLVETAR